ncbi:beta-Ig-H3/fasciclin [Calothrix sp. NIES-4071]|nr:beta-Ig-H3/fasciclin [Calothrix sp. NIES-4071]BAZ58727.1 beta-Ig-H3/fasciclin [Calothrix sp. NIES-4105]
MKVNNSNWLPFLAGVVGVTGIGLLINLPAGAQNKLNPNPGIFAETTYNRSQRVLTNTQYVPSEPTFDALKQNSNKKKKTQSAQNTTPGAKLNPAPSILQECPYNRSACPGGGTSTPTPTTLPVPSGQETPSVPTEPSVTPTPPTTPTEPSVTPTPPTTTPEKPTPGTKPGSQSDSNKNIIAVAQANGSFKTLIQALKAAGLTETLQGKGPFTVFAPTDAAFAELPKDAVRDLLKPENKEVLVKILTYHVVSGQVLSTDLKPGEVKSLQGDPIGVKIDPSTGVTVNDAKVVQPDIKANNGVIHVIDKVILPPTL